MGRDWAFTSGARADRGADVRREGIEQSFVLRRRPPETAGGDRIAATTRWCDGRIELRMDGAWLARAAVPVVVEPLTASLLVSNSITRRAGGPGRPDPPAVTSGGTGSVTLSLPDAPVFVGNLFCQWFHVSAGANPAGLLATRGLQAQVR